MKKSSSILLVALLLVLTVVNFGYPSTLRTVTDGLDRKVSLSETPERVVTTIVSTTEIVLDLGLDERLVGVPNLTKYLSYVPELQEMAKQKEKVGGFKLSMEKIAALNPDLVIVDASAQKDAVSKLEDLGATVYAAGSKNIDEVRETILEIGYLTGTEDRAQEVVGNMAYKEVQLKEAVSNLEDRKETFYTISKRMYTVGGNTFVGQALELAGLTNVFSDLSGYKPVSTEEIIERDPELIIATEDMGLSVENLKKEAGLENVKAVKTGNVLLLSPGEDSMINQPGTKIIDGAINLFEKVYDREVNL
jgi:iron complex transport system substrate-binding protein